MGRRAKSREAIPRLRARRQRSGRVFYYYDHGGRPRREEPLGQDYGLAVRRWAEIEQAGSDRPQEVITFKYVAEKYRAAVIPGKAPRTQRDNKQELARLLEYFDDPPCPLDSIRPMHVNQYMRWRKEAPVRANREKALLSHIWNFARVEGYTDLPNPCPGVRGFKETGRDVYIEDDQYWAICDKADELLREAMELAYLLGQRPSDIAMLNMDAIRDGTIQIKQGKTGTKVRIESIGELARVVERILARKTTCKNECHRLIVNEHGRPIGRHAISERFRKAREAAGVSGVEFRDLRAKAATDKADRTGDMRESQRLLGHKNIRMTEHYVRKRRGEKVKPTR